MPADTIHESVILALPKWKLVRDCIAGPFAVKRAGEAYLPKMSRQTAKEYDGYRCRAVFFNASKRTHRAINGLIHRKPPTMKLTGALKAVETDADLKGSKLLTYCKKVTGEVSAVGRCGTLIDWSDSEKRAYFAFYLAEDIINWRYTRIDGKAVLTLLVLHENVSEEDPADPFTPKNVEQWRAFYIASGSKEVVGQIWRRAEDGTMKEHAKLNLMRKGAALERISFVFHNAEGGDADVGDVPLEDLAHVNVSHYQSSADLENGRHLTGNPTPYAFGIDTPTETGSDGAPEQGGITDGDEIKLGSNSMITSENADAKIGYLEFTGGGLKSLDDAMKQKEEQMAGLGARLIEPRQTDAESFETVSLRANAESSTLASIGINCTATIKEALAWVVYWTDATAELDKAAQAIEFALNSDFTSSAITPEMLTACGAARTANLISAKAYFYNLQRGEFFPEGWKEEDELDAIESKPLMPPPVPVDPNKIDPATGKPFPKEDPGKKPPGAPPKPASRAAA